MPCYLVQIARVDLGEIEPEHLADALRALGLTVKQYGTSVSFAGALADANISGNFSGGRLSLRDVADDEVSQFVNPIKRQLSAQAIKAAAGQYRFTVKQTAANKFVAQKRRA